MKSKRAKSLRRAATLRTVQRSPPGNLVGVEEGEAEVHVEDDAVTVVEGGAESEGSAGADRRFRMLAPGKGGASAAGAWTSSVQFPGLERRGPGTLPVLVGVPAAALAAFKLGANRGA